MKRLYLLVLVLFISLFARAQWEDDVRLSETQDTSLLYYGMCHSIASQGDTVHVVWYDKSEGNWEIFYKRSTDGGINWEENQRLTEDNASSIIPSISLCGSTVNVVWLDTRAGNREIYFKQSVDAGESWEDDIRLTDDPSSGPVIASSANYVHIVWFNLTAEGYAIVYYKNSSDGGISWGEETRMSDGSDLAFNPSVAVSGSNVYAVWNDNRNGALEIYYRKSADNGLTWGPETRLTNDPEFSNLPSIAASGPSVHIAWVDTRDGNYQIYYKGSNDFGANWSADRRINLTMTFSTSPNLSVSGSFLFLVWQDNRNGFSDIYYTYSTDGGMTWAFDIKLNDLSTSSVRPSIAVSNEVINVIWQDNRDNNFEIYYKRNPTGGFPVSIEDDGSYLLSPYKVYPNPVSGELTVGQLDSWTVGQSYNSLSIFDLHGYEKRNIKDVSLPYQIATKDLNDGIYFLQIMNTDGKSGLVKFLKMDN